MQRFSGFIAGMVGFIGLGWWGGLTAQQLIAVGIFASMILATLFFWTYRLAFAFLALCALLATGLLDIPHFIEFAKIDIIMFLVAMMTVVGYLEERRFFEQVIEGVLGRLRPNAWQFCVLIMALGAVSAALVDEVTSILFMTSITLHFVISRGVNPVPFVIMLVFATNIGSAATVVGNPVGVMVALSAGLTFMDFLRWATPVALLGLAVTVPLSLWYFRRPIQELQTGILADTGAKSSHTDSTGREDGMTGSLVIFLGLIGGLILHSPFESWLELPKNTMLLGTALGFAGLVLILDRHHAREIIERRVDWWTLSFFLALFASVGTLRLVGVTGEIAHFMSYLAGDTEIGLMVVVLWGGGVMSALMDNVLAVAMLIPIVQDLQTQGVHVSSLWWGLLFGGTFFGNVTMIGSTANIIAIGILERHRQGTIEFWQWLKPGILVGMITLGLATFLLWLQLPLIRSQP